ncbi:DUF6688 domain-containing protein [Streptococcus sp. S784/96/1]|uniref:DUF6688 domain-containing protein n=1 Tax=Streptococcus sp. S784/96/1 TaxID=2653499 RepID=UPI00308279C8
MKTFKIFLLCFFLSIVIAIFIYQKGNILDTFFYLFGFLFTSPLIYPLPLYLTYLNLKYFKKALSDTRLFDLASMFLGGLLSYFLIVLKVDTKPWQDWHTQLYDYQTHSPIYTAAFPTIIVLLGLGLIGYMILTSIPIKKCPPLILAIGFSFSYIGLITLAIFAIQLGYLNIWGIGLYLFNVYVIYLRSFRKVIITYRQSNITVNTQKNWQIKCHQLLHSSANWHLLSLCLMLPVLGIAISLLTLFGQEPDYMIKAWTETSDWTLSTKVAPPDIFYDEHYLCTVGASGHRKIVKPIRMGVRHGHRIVVNRQLLIANAFEQIIEEKIPRIHKLIRYIYDTYGYSFAKHIKSPWQADVIYFLMKPLEWLFLMIIYLCDSKPENRIALQYIPKPER